ncbi:CLCA4 regulator, partial [Atractosteus spatula]|nr:CLCA4 regulator [Atractosteus spatula]
FCDENTHNFWVQNAQNKLCDYRSVWGVISQTPDFKDGNNPPMTADPPSPTFTLLRARQRVVCLVLDTSGSMTQYQFFSLSLCIELSLKASISLVLVCGAHAQNLLAMSPAGTKTTRFETCFTCMKMVMLCHEKSLTVSIFQYQTGRTKAFTHQSYTGSGTWSYEVVNTHSSPQTFTLQVTSRAINECVPPVIVTGGMSETEVTYPQPLVISAQLSQGTRPVINADVKAVVDLSDKNTVKLDLFDGGADKKKNDGIYSGLFYNYRANGRYSLKFEVQGVEGKVETRLYPDNNVPERPRQTSGRMRRSAPSLRQTSTALGSFSRTASGGTVTVKGVPAVPRDDFPPGKVTDLTASVANKTVVLQWTAPGDDYYTGTVSSYDIRIGLSPQALRESFTAALPLNTSSLHSVPAGQTQTLLLPLESLAAMNQSVVYLALRATDEEGGTSEISSITQVSTFDPLMLPHSQGHASPAPVGFCSVFLLVAALVLLDLSI